MRQDSSEWSSFDDDNRDALLYSWGFGLINTLFALPAVKTIDKFGRRPLLLFSISNMAWTMLAAALSLLIREKDVATGLAVFFLFVFAAFYSPGQGPVPFTYAAEAFPLSHREVGMSFSVAVNLFFAAVLTVIFPRLAEKLGDTGSLGLFAGLNVIALLLVYLWVPETARKTLEELTSVSKQVNVRNRDHMLYQVFEVLPYYRRRYVFPRDQKAQVRDLYSSEEEEPPPANKAYDLPTLPPIRRASAGDAPDILTELEDYMTREKNAQPTAEDDGPSSSSSSSIVSDPYR